jgi:hypothetical protein
MQDNKSLFGQLEYLDDRGYTNKAQRRVNNNLGLEEVNDKIAKLLKRYDIKLVTNPSTIVSNSHISKLTKIINRTKKLWEEVNYPFKDNALIRTDFWDKKVALNRSALIIKIEKTEKMLENIFKNWDKKNFPDQILIHPQISKQRKFTEMIFGQVYYSTDNLIGHFGNGGIDLARFIVKADNQFQVRLNSEVKIKKYSGKYNQYINEIVLKKLMFSFKLMLPFFYKHIIPPKDRHKDISFEFHILKRRDFLYLNYCDFDIS